MKLKEINFNYDTNVISKRQFDEHMKLYKEYVNKFNIITEELDYKATPKNSNSIYSEYRSLKKEETFTLSSIILHEEYFKNMTNEKTTINSKTTKLFEYSFGSINKWKEDFIACAGSSRGWCITAYDQKTKTIRNFLQDTHDSGVTPLSFPLVVLDVYEHAYFIDYNTNKTIYINKFMENINWNYINTKADKIKIPSLLK